MKQKTTEQNKTDDMDAPCVVCGKKEEVDSGMCEDCFNEAKKHLEKRTEQKLQDEIEKQVRKRAMEDIKSKLNPLYSISISSWYSEKEMLSDVIDLMIAENLLGFKLGQAEAEKEFKQVLNNIEINNVIKLLEWIYGDENNASKSENIIYSYPELRTKDVYRIVEKIKELKAKLQSQEETGVKFNSHHNPKVELPDNIQTKQNKKFEIEYKCGHKTDGVIILDNNEMSYSAYFEWSNSSGVAGTRELCWDCYCNKQNKEKNE